MPTTSHAVVGTASAHSSTDGSVQIVFSSALTAVFEELNGHSLHQVCEEFNGRVHYQVYEELNGRVHHQVYEELSGTSTFVTAEVF